jgi:hypothetical protein
VAAVDEELSVDGVADASVEGSHRFVAAVAVDLLAWVVAAAGGVVARVGHGGHVDGVRELTVAERVSRSRTICPLEASIGAVAS